MLFYFLLNLSQQILYCAVKKLDPHRLINLHVSGASQITKMTDVDQCKHLGAVGQRGRGKCMPSYKGIQVQFLKNTLFTKMNLIACAPCMWLSVCCMTLRLNGVEIILLL